MSEDTLTVVESASQKRIELDSLVQSACECLRLIEPWNNAKSDHDAVVPIIQSVQKQGTAYYHALDLSVMTAQNGYTFCSDAELLCDYLLDPSNTVEELQEFITDMRSIAQRAHKDALEMSELFRSITKGIPVEVAKLEEEERRARELKAKADRNKYLLRNTTAIAAAGSAVIGATIAMGIASFPPFILFLPAILPIFGLVSGVMANNCEKIVAEREKQALKCVDAMQQLQRANTDLTTLVQHVDQFSDWWLEQDTMLKALGDKVQQLEASRVKKLRIKSIKTGWGEVRGSYLEYKTKVSRLQDYYPSSRLTADESSSILGVVARMRKQNTA